MNACKITLSKIKSALSFLVMHKKESITGRFARPILKKGTGFGTAYSTAERKKHNAEKKASFLINILLLKVNH